MAPLSARHIISRKAAEQLVQEVAVGHENDLGVFISEPVALGNAAATAGGGDAGPTLTHWLRLYTSGRYEHGVVERRPPAADLIYTQPGPPTLFTPEGVVVQADGRRVVALTLQVMNTVIPARKDARDARLQWYPATPLRVRLSVSEADWATGRPPLDGARWLEFESDWRRAFEGAALRIDLHGRVRGCPTPSATTRPPSKPPPAERCDSRNPPQSDVHTPRHSRVSAELTTTAGQVPQPTALGWPAQLPPASATLRHRPRLPSPMAAVPAAVQAVAALPAGLGQRPLVRHGLPELSIYDHGLVLASPCKPARRLEAATAEPERARRWATPPHPAASGLV